ncbi:siderophore-iron reductase FhuF [Bacillus suaedaesalsae]|uniref:Siderophore-iron reductase FhuF n=1 Tax=Bacillus suaedaesalsae TaxID=2810349 RepID=A0ABS2DN54_9BACI|nr:siderophore-iron reductase FhuF [Bacillus suaedaesalsae]MBM6618911.1 siderophore-iron reductase FhuF [Bacillus suaedaesalsae]
MAKNQLQPHELERLVQSFRITLEQSNDPLSFPSKNLLSTEFVSELIEQLKGVYNVREHYVIASQFMKRYAFMVVVPYFYSLSMWNKQLDMDIEKVTFQSKMEDGAWLPRLQLQTIDVTMSDPNDRAEWLRTSLKKLFKQHLDQVIKVLAPTGKISRQVLWENTAIYIFWIYEIMFKENTSEQVKQDLEFLLNADGSMFGDYTYNPIAKFYSEKKSNEEVRTRKTCCFYDRLPGVKGRCSTCPVTCKIPDEEGDGICG